MTKIELEKNILELQLEVERKKLDIAKGQLTKKKQSIWRNPLFLGVIAAFIGFMSNVITTQLQTKHQTAIKEKEFQSSLIIEAIKTGDVELAKKNLEFFVEAGFIDDYTGNLSEIIEKTTPILPNSLGKFSNTELSIVNATGKVIINDGNSEIFLSGILLRNNILMTVIFNSFNSNHKIQVEFGNNLKGGRPKKFDVNSSPIEEISLEGGLSINLFKVVGNPSEEYHSFKIKSTKPEIGGILRQLENPNSGSIVFSNCVIIDLLESEFHHNCATGPGSAGNILIDNEDNIIGIHYGVTDRHGIAIRFDKIVEKSETLKKIIN